MSADTNTRRREWEEREAAFHRHLDVCVRCHDHPFNLCAIGAKLLREAATGTVA